MGADINSTRVPIAGRVGMRHSIGGAAVVLEAGALVEAWNRRSVVCINALEPTVPSTMWRLGGTPGERFEVPIGSAVGLFTLGAARWLPASHTLSVQPEQGGERIPTYTNPQTSSPIGTGSNGQPSPS